MARVIVSVTAGRVTVSVTAAALEMGWVAPVLGVRREEPVEPIASVTAISRVAVAQIGTLSEAGPGATTDRARVATAIEDRPAGDLAGEVGSAAVAVEVPEVAVGGAGKRTGS